MGFMGTFYPGMKVNALDLAPNYAGTIMAITNGIGAITGIITPLLVGNITYCVSGRIWLRLLLLTVCLQHSLEQWRTVFWIAFGVFMVTNVIYVIFGSADEQAWNDPTGTKLDAERGGKFEKPKALEPRYCEPSSS